MSRTAARLIALAALTVALAGTGTASAQGVVVTHYCPPTVTYYPAPAVAVAPVRTVTYYAPAVPVQPVPVVTSFAAPLAVSPAAAATTTRYGLFGRPRRTTSAYYPPLYVSP